MQSRISLYFKVLVLYSFLTQVLQYLFTKTIIMRKASLLFVLLGSALLGMGQGSTLWTVSWGKPKADQVTAFEAALKAHVQKFHQSPKDMYVYEILSGDNAGSYQFIHGPGSWASMDSSVPNAEHDADWEKTIAPKLQSESGNYIYRYIDSVSYNNKEASDKQRLAFYSWKDDVEMEDVMDYLKETKSLYENSKDPRSYSIYNQQLAGSHLVTVQVLRLTKWAQLETDFYPNFKKLYIKEHGQRAWDKRAKFFEDNIKEVNAFIRKFRPDLSTPSK